MVYSSSVSWCNNMLTENAVSHYMCSRNTTCNLLFTACLETFESNPTVRSGFPRAAKRKRIRFLRGMRNYNGVISTAIGTSLAYCMISSQHKAKHSCGTDSEEVKVKLEQQSAQKQLFS